MTKKELTYALSRGLGRAYLAIKENPEKYKKEVVKTLSVCPAFDPQCEGTRSYYSYAIFCCYEQPEYFRDIIINRFLRLSPADCGWNTAYYAEVLVDFACDGDKIAEKTLVSRYKTLYDLLWNKKERQEGLFPEHDNFEFLCNALSVRMSNFRRIAKDLGRLFLHNPNYDGGSFVWFSHSDYFKRLSRNADKDECIAAFVNAVNKYDAEQEEIRRERESDPVYQAKRASRRKKYIERELFREIPLPQNESDLLKLLAELGTDKENESTWHRFHFDIFELFKRKSAPRYLKSALPIIYSTTLCSNCRASALCEMGKRRMLTPEILNECLYDSNSDIVKFAKRRLKRITPQ